MKYLFGIWILLNLLFIACDDHDDDQIVLPASVQQAVNEAEIDASLCDVCNVEIYEFEGKQYYNLYCSHWSCIFCKLFDEDGNEVSGDSFNFDGFIENKKLVRMVPMCQN